MLFTAGSIWTMVHGVGLGGGALLGLAAALFYLYAAPLSAEPVSASIACLTIVTATLLWSAAVAGTFIIAPLYLDVSAGAAAPRALLLAHADTAWLHTFSMESKKHAPWIASMLATAVAFVSVRYRTQVVQDAPVRWMAIALLAISFALVAFIAMMGVFVNKVAPVQ